MILKTISENSGRYRELTSLIFSDKKRIEEGKLFIPAKITISSTELLALKNDIKPSVRIDIPFNEKMHSMIKDLCKNNKFFMYHSDYKFISNSNLDVSWPIKLNSPKKGLVFYYISKNEKIAKELKRCDRGVNFERFSALLGYPDCCIEFAKKLRPGSPENHVRDAIKYDDYLWSTNHVRSFRNSKQFSFYLNKYSILGLVSHTPCHLNCKESKIYAKKLLSIIRGENKELAQITEYLLKLPSLFWNYADKIVFQGEKKGDSLRYHDFLTNLNSHIKFSSFPDHELSAKLMKIASMVGKGDMLENSKSNIRIFKNSKLIAEFEKPYEFECILTEPNTN
ncbi:MAG: DUF483 domain-containing protein [Candidatus Aenigmarchaeota archaeon]|nr:DUF483 domain-containing protein [Candidatus Aenigmarchaeota archaeon]